MLAEFVQLTIKLRETIPVAESKRCKLLSQETSVIGKVKPVGVFHPIHSIDECADSVSQVDEENSPMYVFSGNEMQ